MTIKDEKNPPRRSSEQDQVAGPGTGGQANADGFHVSAASGGFHIAG